MNVFGTESADNILINVRKEGAQAQSSGVQTTKNMSATTLDNNQILRLKGPMLNHRFNIEISYSPTDASDRVNEPYYVPWFELKSINLISNSDYTDNVQGNNQ